MQYTSEAGSTAVTKARFVIGLRKALAGIFSAFLFASILWMTVYRPSWIWSSIILLCLTTVGSIALALFGRSMQQRLQRVEARSDELERRLEVQGGFCGGVDTRGPFSRSAKAVASVETQIQVEEVLAKLKDMIRKGSY